MSTRLRADYSRRTEVDASYAGRCVARSASLVEKMIAETEAHLVTGYVMDEGVDIICLGELSEDVWLAEEPSQ